MLPHGKPRRGSKTHNQARCACAHLEYNAVGVGYSRLAHFMQFSEMPLFRFKPEIRFFPGRPFIKRPEGKKRKRTFFIFIFLSLESSTYDSSAALILRLIPRTPADYVYVCNRAHDEPGSSSYVCCSGKRSYHTQPWNQVYDFMRRWFPIAVFISNTPTLLAGYQPSPCHMAIWD